jgi:hypothetical protein
MAMNLRKYASASKFINLDELKDRPPLREQIAVVKVEDGKFGERVVLIFESGRQLSLNKTFVGNLVRDIGEDDDSWIGQFVEVYAGQTTYQGTSTDAVLVRPIEIDTLLKTPTNKAAATVALPIQKIATKASDFDDDVPW